MKLISRIEDLPPALASSVSPEEAAFVALPQGTGHPSLWGYPFFAHLVEKGGADMALGAGEAAISLPQVAPFQVAPPGEERDSPGSIPS